ncbi:MAG: D-2-hydroxyacid dehydrogenase [Gammaproteobacteria bacterium]|nr:D-2-hydroxyacid dehydrogenase [Gammaproteobacteria bacterium]
MKLRLLLAAAASLQFATALQAQDVDANVMAADLGMWESDVPAREMPGWQQPDDITILTFGAMPESGIGSRAWFLEATGDVNVTFFAAGGDTDYSEIAETDVIVGWCSPDAISAAESVQYLHFYSAGIDRCASIPGIADRGLIATNSAKAASETIAEHGIALMLMMTRGLHHHYRQQMKEEWRGYSDAPGTFAVKGKTMLVLGLGGIGSQIAQRAHDLGMMVIGTRNSSRSGPDFVSYVGLADEADGMASKADVIVNALPLTDATRGTVDGDFFDAMKQGAFYISVGRGGTTDTDALMDALKSGKLAGAGLDVTDPEPLPAGHPLWTMPNVVISPHSAAGSDMSRANTMLLARENLRRYINGEKLLNVVDFARGY